MTRQPQETASTFVDGCEILPRCARCVCCSYRAQTDANGPQGCIGGSGGQCHEDWTDKCRCKHSLSNEHRPGDPGFVRCKIVWCVCVTKAPREETTMDKITKAEYRRRFPLGARFECTQHLIQKYVGTIRTITKVQTNGVWFKLDDDEKDQNYWSPFSTVTEARANENEISVKYRGDETPRMTLRSL